MVDFPQPELPTINTVCPGEISKSRPRKTLTPGREG